MRQRDSGIIDLTSLLDVVFILLFALIINVNIQRVEDHTLIAEQEQTIVAERAKAAAYEAAAKHSGTMEEQLAKQLMDSETALIEAENDKRDLALTLKALDSQLQRQQTMLKAYEEAMAEALDREIRTEEDPELKEWLKAISEGEIVIEEWMKFQQIAERYLFVDIRVRASDGRIYVNGDYTGIQVDHSTAIDAGRRSEVIHDLQLHIVDWLDHKEGGYSFVFVTVVEEGAITRAMAQTVYDCLQGLQITFDKDYYMVNRFVRSAD